MGLFYKPCMTIALYHCSALPGTPAIMQNFKTIETPVLVTMLVAHTAYHGKKHSVKELSDCKKIIRRLNLEIESRKAVLAVVLYAKMPLQTV